MAGTALPRNAEATKKRILDAAMAEFAAHGVAGARVERIASAARCNKNLIYIYFQSKETLFTTTLQQNLLRVYEEIPFSPDDLPAYAGKVFDFAMAHPDLMRLMAWFNLEFDPKTQPARQASRDTKLAALKRMQKTGQLGDTFSPGFLLTVILSIATAWSALSPFGMTLDPISPRKLALLRDSVTGAVAALISA